MRSHTETGGNVPRKPNPPPDNPEQSKRFLETAGALEVDKTGKIFENVIKKIIPSAKKKVRK